jgi:hypothetical protein
MIDYDDEEVRWWVREVEYMVNVMQSDREEITVQSLARKLHDLHDLPGAIPSDELLEMCDDYLRRQNDPFYGIYDASIDLKLLTESQKNDLFTDVTAKSKLFKSHAAELDAYLEQMQQGSSAKVTG